MAVVFDIEADDLYPAVKKVWLLCTEDTETGEAKAFSDYDPELPSLQEGLDYLHTCKIIVGHNIIGYDLVVMDKLLDWKPKPEQVIYDTWIMSMLLRYKRPHKHGLAGWGGYLGYPKIDYNDFSKYTKDMLKYCQRDVSLNVKVYQKLVEEVKSTMKINPLFKVGLKVENEFARIEADIRTHGWRFDQKRAEELLEEMATRMKEIEDEIEPQIGLVCCKVDPAKEFKQPLLKKNGEYAASTCKWFGITPDNALEERLVDGPYCRIEFEQGRLGSDRVLKAWLYSLGWEPDEWNVERINGQFVQKSPKLTESSLEPLGDTGRAIVEYNSISNRHGILKGWLKEIEYDGRLHGRMWTIGTPTFRCRHEVIANLPTVEAKYGKEMRGLLLPKKGWVIVGADSSGNQMRGLCHRIGNDDFTHEVVEGDVHTRNATALQEFTGLSPKEGRSTAKPFLYAYLFGGGAGKLALILTGRRDADLGKAAIAKFQNSIPGLADLKKRLEKQFEATKERFGEEWAFIRGIDGRIVFVKSKHQVLNYDLQTIEGVTCKAAAVYFKEKAAERGLTYNFLLHYHDEFAVECPPEEADEVAELAKEAFREAPKWFGITCMGGDAKIGKNYAEVH
jgi:DNA polymerase-1